MRTIALIKRICQQMLRDKRTLALLFVAPLLILSLMYFFFNGGTVEQEIGVVNVDDSLVQTLEDADINVTEYETASSKVIMNEDLDGLLEMNDGEIKLTLQNDDPSKAKALQMVIKQTVAKHLQTQMMSQMKIPENKASIDMDIDYIYGNDQTDFFDVLSPVLVGFFVFFFVFIISGIGLLKERTSGTLERLMSTPIRRGEIVTAYLVGFGIFAIIQTIIVVLYSISVLDIVMEGTLLDVIAINLLLALVALSLGTLLSTFANSEFQMVQFIPVAAIPQLFFAGIFPLDSMADWLQILGKIMPMYYAGDALKGVMYKGLGLGDVAGDILALAIFAVVFIVLNVFALKKYRTL